MKCLLRLEKKAHDLDLGSPFSSNDEKCDDEKSSKDEESKVDGVYDIYGCQTLLLRDADDAVKEGVGERLCRVWKFLTLLQCWGQQQVCSRRLDR